MFILNQISDKYTKTTGQIVLKAFLWLICLTAVGAVIRIACIAIYKANGINPMEITSFLGDPSTYVSHATWSIILAILFAAPICEELIFRLGLGFTRKVNALWVGILPVLIASFFLKCKTWYVILALLIVGVALYFLVYFFTTDDQWKVWKEKCLKYAVWITAIAFGLVHLIAFSTINLQALPFILTTILLPFFAGCVATYARVNLNFFWGLLFHIVFNIPDCVLIFMSMINKG